MATTEEILHWFRYEAEDREGISGWSAASTLDVAKAFGLTTDSAYRILARMARQGLLTRRGRLSMRGRFRGLQSGRGSEPGWQVWEYTWPKN